MRSTTRSASAQAHIQHPSADRWYLALSGADPVEYGITLDWTVQRVIEIVQATGDDIVLWLIDKGDPPRIVAFIRPGVASSAVVKYV